ncbi:hypothetical protein AQS8620_01593 [Aquimixticola soesokkakensis]|uniref:Uncharacterized protein n=1 Tax=Aquimixticola soesokkakensis TaxID=1519096 RepID=A0A1Y5SJ86_9RHOB|nr:hypothetical protein [Aquimixticola soesokkakensis]SLN41407.1 hypothetical protein AQS8620_01593 [Aquimixticola soesokkakensis]
MSDWIMAEVPGARVALDPQLGNIRELVLGGGPLLHTAHWVGTEAAKDCAAPVDAHLAGDFFCAPFGAHGMAGVPPHGWSANSDWAAVTRAHSAERAILRLELQREVMGARIAKEIKLRAHHPTLYQTHRISGGRGLLPFAAHPMIRMRAGGRISTSPKRLAFTPPQPIGDAERLKYPAQSTDITAFPALDGSVDLTRFSSGTGHEDFVTLVEAQGRSWGWTAVVRSAEEDIVFFLKDARLAPVTMLWLSNGGRFSSPWDGRHEGVLGIEDGHAAGGYTQAQAQAGETPLADLGLAGGLVLDPDTRFDFRHAIGRIAKPAGWKQIADIALEADKLILSEVTGAQITLPFMREFLSF